MNESAAADAVSVAITWCQAFARWDRREYLQGMGLPLVLAEFFDLDPSRRPPDFLAEVESDAHLEHVSDDAATVVVRLPYLAHGKRWIIDRVRLRREADRWRVVDYRDHGDWRSTQTCMHVNAPQCNGPIWLCPVMVRQAAVGDFWTFVVHNAGSHAGRLVLHRRDLQDVAMSRDPGESQLFFAGIRSEAPLSWSVKPDRRWARATTTEFVLPLPPPEHPRQGWCRGYSHWQFAVARIADRLHPASLPLSGSATLPDSAEPWHQLQRSKPRSPELL